MLKIYGDTTCKLLELIFKQVLTTDMIPSEWKKGNIVPCCKKVTIKAFKITAQFLYFLFVANLLKCNEIFTLFLANNFLAPNQSGFKPGDSCINQLLSITHEIYSSFDDGFEIRGDFLDISKASDKV